MFYIFSSMTAYTNKQAVMQPNPLNSPVIQVIWPKQKTAWIINFFRTSSYWYNNVANTYIMTLSSTFLKVWWVRSKCYRMKKLSACVNWTIMCTCPTKTVSIFFCWEERWMSLEGLITPEYRVISVLTMHSTSTPPLQPFIKPIIGVIKVIRGIFCLFCVGVRQE